MDRADITDKFDYKVDEEQCPYVETDFDDGYVCCTKAADHEGDHVSHGGTILKDCVIPCEPAFDYLGAVINEAQSLVRRLTNSDAGTDDFIEFVQRVADIKA